MRSRTRTKRWLKTEGTRQGGKVHERVMVEPRRRAMRTSPLGSREHRKRTEGRPQMNEGQGQRKGTTKKQNC